MKDQLSQSGKQQQQQQQQHQQQHNFANSEETAFATQIKHPHTGVLTLAQIPMGGKCNMSDVQHC